MLLSRLLAASALPLGFAAAQVQTKCNPLERDGCPADPALGAEGLWNFDGAPPSELWETTAGVVDYDAKTGAAFTIRKQGDSPTIRTRFYFFFGRTEILLRAAPGRGIISSMMWLSDDLDEVDWEFLGSNTTYATTNFFGKGRQDFHNGGAHPMTGMQADYHNYTTVWTKEQIDWYIDGGHVRTLKAADANRTANYPQTPMRMSIGIWAGGDPSLPEGTRVWAGGDTDYAGGPYTMYLKKAKVTDFSTGREYAYGDRSGSWQSIKVQGGNSTASNLLNQEPEKSVRDRWRGLSRTTKIAIGSGVGGVGALAIAALLLYFLRQRRKGAKEARLAEQRAKAERVEMEHFETKGFDPDGYSARGGSSGVDEMQQQPQHGEEDHGGGRSRKGGGVANMNDADSYHVPETATASPLGAGDWSGSVGSSTVSVSSASTRQSPRVDSPAPLSHYRHHNNALGFDFGVPMSPVRQQASRVGSPMAGGVTRSSSPTSPSQSSGSPSPGALPSPRSRMRMDPVSRMGSPALEVQSPPGLPSPGRSIADGRQEPPGAGH